MIGRYGPPIFQILNGLDGAYNVALIKAIPREEIFSKKYEWFILKQEKLFQFVEKLSQRSSGQTGVDLFELKKYQIPLPPLKEQAAIANILSDMDAEISQLEGRRAKMGELKQGMMQELLTGRIRLTGGRYL
jgi:type I restriction enzyme S subunit